MQRYIVHDSESHRQGLREIGIESTLPGQKIDDQDRLGAIHWPEEQKLACAQQHCRPGFLYKRRTNLRRAFLTSDDMKMCTSDLLEGPC